jgi:hypothetical protein
MCRQGIVRRCFRKQFILAFILYMQDTWTIWQGDVAGNRTGYRSDSVVSGAARIGELSVVLYAPFTTG